eukprot:12451_3
MSYINNEVETDIRKKVRQLVKRITKPNVMSKYRHCWLYLTPKKKCKHVVSWFYFHKS